LLYCRGPYFLYWGYFTF